MKRTNVLIIGAGISGLLCAAELQAAGKAVRLVDKGRGVGGRMATRRMAGGRLDHGAQFLTVRDARFGRYVDAWIAAGTGAEWFRHGSGDPAQSEHPRYRGVTGMSDFPKHLAKDLEVHCSEPIRRVSRLSEEWVVQSESGAVFLADHLVITAPLPQALVLLERSGLDFSHGQMDALRAVEYEKGLATLAILDGPSGLPAPGGQQVEASPLSWIADNQMKGISPDVSAITIHADAVFAAKHWDSPNELRGPLMLAAAAPWLQAKVIEYNCHRWGFAFPVNPFGALYFHNSDLKLTLAGDAFGGARVEGAALSGLEAAQAVLASS